MSLISKFHVLFFFHSYIDWSNSILRYLKKKQPKKGGENNASGSGVGSNINECQRDEGNECESNIHSKSGGGGSNSGQSSRENEDEWVPFQWILVINVLRWTLVIWKFRSTTVS